MNVIIGQCGFKSYRRNDLTQTSGDIAGLTQKSDQWRGFDYKSPTALCNLNYYNSTLYVFSASDIVWTKP